MKGISNRPRTQRLALSNPDLLRSLCTVHHDDRHIAHLHLVYIPVLLGPLIVLDRGVGADGPQVADKWQAWRALHPGYTDTVACDFIDDDVREEK